VERGGEEAGGAQEVIAAEVVEGDGGLDEGLEEELFGLRGVEPDALPGFVGGEVFGGVVVAEAFGERASGPVEAHCVEFSWEEAVGSVMRAGDAHDISGPGR
jgi:hypothetical protein